LCFGDDGVETSANRGLERGEELALLVGIEFVQSVFEVDDQLLTLRIAELRSAANSRTR